MNKKDMISHIKFILVVLLCMLVSGERCIEREREALVSFKNGLIDESDILSSWHSDDCCEWYGVVCSNTTAHVIALELGTVEFHGVLRGEVGYSLLELHHLSSLDLSWNDFGGVPIPEFIGSMMQLQHLYLYISNFSGIVPPQLGNLTNLITLDLSHNSLRSENFNWLSTLSSLSFLDLSDAFDLSHTNFVQQIPKLHALLELRLHSCNMSDVKPHAGGLLNSSSSSLSTLVLSNNHLTSSTFDWLSNISSSLVEIDLSFNALGVLAANAFERLILLEHLCLHRSMLEGEIPKSIGNLSHLRTLILNGNDLRGQVDVLLRNLSSLEFLDLSDNQLNGSVPDLEASIALTGLFLNINKFMGSVPASLGQLSKLEVIDVSNNSLEGAMTESHLNNLGNLKILDLSFTSLTLHIAPDWNPPFQLEHIILSGCNVGPSFPKWIQTQRNFSELHLSSAGLRDETPDWLWNLSPSMRVLILFDNQISGTIPDLSSTSIRIIDVSSNFISGPIPSFNPNIESIQLSQNMFGSISSVCKIPHHLLIFLDLSNNKLVGDIPNCWGNMSSMSYLILANNSFSGQIPHSLGSLGDLIVLQLHGNNLSGELPFTLKNCTRLELINVGGNRLTGYIPGWIDASYKELFYMNFRSNRFYGTIPPQVCNLTNVRILDFSNNSLSGKIPDCFNNFTSLAQKKNPTYIYYYSEHTLVQWKGHEWNFRGQLVFLKLIDFSSNRLTGNIPKSFSCMRGLHSLNLSRNCLSGHIILDIGEMEMLECLDLSQNQLTGEIPSSLAQLHYLDVLDLSNNNLSGKIPSSTQLQSFDISSYAGNNGLCDPPLELCLKERLRPLTTTQEEKDEYGFWSLSFMQGVGISMAFGIIVGFWGVVASFVLNKSWRNAYFNFLNAWGDLFYVRTIIFLSKFKRS